MEIVKKIIRIIERILALLALFVIAAFVFLWIFVWDDVDFCSDSQICAEGLSLNVDGQKIIINEQTCKENGGVWLYDRKACSFRD